MYSFLFCDFYLAMCIKLQWYNYALNNYQISIQKTILQHFFSCMWVKSGLCKVVRLTLFYSWSRRVSGTGITAEACSSSPGLGRDTTAAVWSASPRWVWAVACCAHTSALNNHYRHISIYIRICQSCGLMISMCTFPMPFLQIFTFHFYCRVRCDCFIPV